MMTMIPKPWPTAVFRSAMVFTADCAKNKFPNLTMSFPVMSLCRPAFGLHDKVIPLPNDFLQRRGFSLFPYHSALKIDIWSRLCILAIHFQQKNQYFLFDWRFPCLP